MLMLILDKVVGYSKLYQQTLGDAQHQLFRIFQLASQVICTFG